MILQVLLWIEHDMLQAFGEETDKKKKATKETHRVDDVSPCFPFFCLCVCDHIFLTLDHFWFFL